MNTLPKYVIIHILAGLVLTSSGPVLAGDLPLASDIAFFRSGNGKTRMEVYLALDRSGITYKQSRRGQTAELATVVVVKQNRQVVDYKEFTIKDERKRDVVPSGTISRQATFALSPATYEVHIVAEEKSGRRAEQIFFADVPFFEGHIAEISSGQLASLIRRTKGPRDYLKHGLYVIPNASRQYEPGSTLIWYYTEAYGLTPLDTIEIHTEVWRDDSLLVTREPKFTPSPSHTLVHWGALNPGYLATGENVLRIRMIVAGDTVATEQVFMVAAGNPEAVDTVEIFSLLTEAEQTDFAGGLSLLTDLGLRQYRSANASVKRQLFLEAMNQVVERRGGDTTLTPKELHANWEQVKSFDRYEIALRRLSEPGRIVFLHGQPDAIDTYPATSTHREYQVWEYVRGDSILQAVFLDRKGYGDFTLEHATLPGGKQNPDWQNQLPWGAKPKPAAPVAIQLEAEPIPAAEVEEAAEPEVVQPDEVLPTESIQDSVITEAALPDALPTGVLPDTLLTEPAAEDTLQIP